VRRPRSASLKPLSERVATFLRSALAGGVATFVDLAVIAGTVGVLDASPRDANVPALLAGAVVQFFGNRHFAFRAGGASFGRQAALFAASEAVALALNAALYHAVAVAVPLDAAGAVVARAITTNLVFVLWSYPVWRRVFQPARAAGAAG
jgi:putative flippase GtrA